MKMKNVLKLKVCFVIYLCGLIQIGCATAQNTDEIIERSLGKLILLHDRKYSYQDDQNPFGSALIYEEFLRLYNEKIKSLPEIDRVNFFWASMWHLDFDGHYMEKFQEVVMQDCGAAYMARLQAYIKEESVLQRNRTRLHLSNKVLQGMKLLEKSTKHSE